MCTTHADVINADVSNSSRAEPIGARELKPPEGV
jgi:hypothetical protein